MSEKVNPDFLIILCELNWDTNLYGCELNWDIITVLLVFSNAVGYLPSLETNMCRTLFCLNLTLQYISRKSIASNLCSEHSITDLSEKNH